MTARRAKITTVQSPHEATRCVEAGTLLRLWDGFVYVVLGGSAGEWMACCRCVDIDDDADPAAHAFQRNIELAAARERLSGLPEFDDLVAQWGHQSPRAYSAAVERFLVRYADAGARLAQGGRASATARFGDAAERAERDGLLNIAARELLARNPAMSEREACRRVGAQFGVSRETVRNALKKSDK